MQDEIGLRTEELPSRLTEPNAKEGAEPNQVPITLPDIESETADLEIADSKHKSPRRMSPSQCLIQNRMAYPNGGMQEGQKFIQEVSED